MEDNTPKTSVFPPPLDKNEQLKTEMANTRQMLGAAEGELTWMAAEKRVNMHHAAVRGCETLRAESGRWRDRAEKAEAKLAALVKAVESLAEIYPDTEGLPEAADGESGKRWGSVAVAIAAAKESQP